MNENEFLFVSYSRPYQDGSLVFEVRLGDVMDLICPFYDEQQSYMTSELEQYDIYRVGFPFFFSLLFIPLIIMILIFFTLGHRRRISKLYDHFLSK